MEVGCFMFRVKAFLSNRWYFFVPPPSGPAAFRGTTGDRQQRSLSGNHREVHLPAQIQKGNSPCWILNMLCVVVHACCSVFWDRVHTGLLCSFQTSDVLSTFRWYCSVFFYQRLQLWIDCWGKVSVVFFLKMYLNKQSNTLPPNTEGVGERHWPTVNPWSLGIYWEKYAPNPRIGEKWQNNQFGIMSLLTCTLDFTVILGGPGNSAKTSLISVTYLFFYLCTHKTPSRKYVCCFVCFSFWTKWPFSLSPMFKFFFPIS